MPIRLADIQPNPVGPECPLADHVQCGFLDSVNGFTHPEGKVEPFRPEMNGVSRQPHRPGRCDAEDACPHDRSIKSKFSQLACRFHRIFRAKH